jgi:hypothetical protein
MRDETEEDLGIPVPVQKAELLSCCTVHPESIQSTQQGVETPPSEVN